MLVRLTVNTPFAWLKLVVILLLTRRMLQLL